MNREMKCSLWHIRNKEGQALPSNNGTSNFIWKAWHVEQASFYIKISYYLFSTIRSKVFMLTVLLKKFIVTNKALVIFVRFFALIKRMLVLWTCSSLRQNKCDFVENTKTSVGTRHKKDIHFIHHIGIRQMIMKKTPVKLQKCNCPFSYLQFSANRSSCQISNIHELPLCCLPWYVWNGMPAS